MDGGQLLWCRSNVVDRVLLTPAALSDGGMVLGDPKAFTGTIPHPSSRHKQMPSTRPPGHQHSTLPHPAAATTEANSRATTPRLSNVVEAVPSMHLLVIHPRPCPLPSLQTQSRPKAATPKRRPQLRRHRTSRNASAVWTSTLRSSSAPRAAASAAAHPALHQKRNPRPNSTPRRQRVPRSWARRSTRKLWACMPRGEWGEARTKTRASCNREMSSPGIHFETRYIFEPRVLGGSRRLAKQSRAEGRPEPEHVDADGLAMATTMNHLNRCLYRLPISPARYVGTCSEPERRSHLQRQFPDYYETIKHPMALSIIHQRLYSSQPSPYPTFEAVVNDFYLIWNNAKRCEWWPASLSRWPS